MPRAKPKTTPSDLQVVQVALADLQPYPKNPRHITPAAVNAVAESLAAFGWQQPIVIDPKKVIVAGHTRLLAALQLGWTHAPTVTIAAKHARAYRLADNRSGEFSTWDLDVLGGELAALPSGLLEALPALDFDQLAASTAPLESFPERVRQPEHELGNMTFVVAEAHRAKIEAALRGAKSGLPSEMDGNANSNGLALYRIVTEWEEQKTS